MHVAPFPHGLPSNEHSVMSEQWINNKKIRVPVVQLIPVHPGKQMHVSLPSPAHIVPVEHELLHKTRMWLLYTWRTILNVCSDGKCFGLNNGACVGIGRSIYIDLIVIGCCSGNVENVGAIRSNAHIIHRLCKIHIGSNGPVEQIRTEKKEWVSISD